jgi:predicted nucleotidyltransferase
MSTSSNTLLLNDSILTEIVKRLVAEFHPTRIFLFGSRARGTSAPDYHLAQPELAIYEGKELYAA